ncbi:hypothetical protein [Pseudoalteromonas rubra]|uniref:Uncharacterized protein n=1 Tax=Pseudoalteromonas rubra TaxID=43658 RepID=A0A5S3X2R9_9GAMM|nr:hypothetical protein [Pseudoalteromonas rubra]TMP38258.1 hypothetical protein CWB98_07170 [Pseudoalteromonas rubra]
MKKTLFTLLAIASGLYASTAVATDGMFIFNSQGKEIRVSYMTNSKNDPLALAFHLNCAGSCDLQSYTDQVISDFVYAAEHSQLTGCNPVCNQKMSLTLAPNHTFTRTDAAERADEIKKFSGSENEPRLYVVNGQRPGVPSDIRLVNNGRLEAIDGVQFNDLGSQFTVTLPLSGEQGAFSFWYGAVERILIDYTTKPYENCKGKVTTKSNGQIMTTNTCSVVES